LAADGQQKNFWGDVGHHASSLLPGRFICCRKYGEARKTIATESVPAWA